MLCGGLVRSAKAFLSSDMTPTQVADKVWVRLVEGASRVATVTSWCLPPVLSAGSMSTVMSASLPAAASMAVGAAATGGGATGGAAACAGRAAAARGGAIAGDDCAAARDLTAVEDC